jgi:hypothetical protein
MAARLKLVILGLFILSRVAFAQATFLESLDNTTIRKGYKEAQIEFKGMQIPPLSSVEITAYWVGSWDGMDAYLTASTGNPTILITWYLMDGTVVATENLTSGTPIVHLKSSFFKAQFSNGEAITANVTGNFLAWDD